MTAHRTAWHFLFTIHLRQRGSPSFDVRDEVPLSEEPPRMDYLILRKAEAAAKISPAATLAGLWPRLSLVTVVELKTVGRPYRAGNLDRLWAYVHLYRAAKRDELPLRSDLRAVLIVPSRTPSLLDDVDEMGLEWEDLDRGYWQIRGGLFTLLVVELDEMEEYEEVIRKLLSTLTPEQRLAGLAPEQRLAGLDRDQQALALPVELLRVLPEEYIRSLSVEVQDEIRRRIQEAAH